MDCTGSIGFLPNFMSPNVHVHVIGLETSAESLGHHHHHVLLSFSVEDSATVVGPQ
jgi:hypothetical protein